MTLRLPLASLTVTLLGAACSSSSDAGTEGACTAGQKNCECTAESTCDDGLTCEQGYCVTEVGCTIGEAGCACFPNSTCSGDLLCTAGICGDGSTDADVVDSDTGATDGGDEDVTTSPDTATEDTGTQDTAEPDVSDDDTSGPTPGGLGDPCSVEAPCGVADGKQLVCDDGVCELPASWTPGSLACACGPADACDAGLACSNGLCLEATQTTPGVTVGSADVRACGFVIELPNVTATFPAGVMGKAKRKGDRLAVSFTATADAAFSGAAVFIKNPSGTNALLGGLPFEALECFDRHGAAVANPQIEME